MSKVRAKFHVVEIKHRHVNNSGDVCAEVIMQPVYGEGNENASFSKHTPQGKIEMTITNPDAVDKFDLGKSYYVDFTPAD